MPQLRGWCCSYQWLGMDHPRLKLWRKSAHWSLDRQTSTESHNWDPTWSTVHWNHKLKSTFNGNFDETLEGEYKLAWEWKIPGSCSFVGRDNFHGVYLQESIQAVMVESQERSSHDFGKGRGWKTLWNTLRVFSISKAYCTGKRQLEPHPHQTKCHFS